MERYKIQDTGYRVNSRKALFLSFLILVSCLLSLVSCTYAESVSSKELIERAKELDGKEIAYKGEAVTAILNRGGYSWINLNDGDSAIGVWCSTADLKPVRFIGDYKNKGDILEVTGVFNRACRSHGGDMDIHASDVKIVKTGHILAENLNKRKTVLSAILFSIVLSLALIFRKRM